jgi:hypothetical protein
MEISFKTNNLADALTILDPQSQKYPHLYGYYLGEPVHLAGGYSSIAKLIYQPGGPALTLIFSLHAINLRRE